MNSSSWSPRGGLSACSWLAPLVRDAIAGVGGFPGVASEAAEFLTPAAMESAPAWSSPWFEGWRAGQIASQTDPGSTAAVAHNLDALRAGTADVVVTGQQPGFLGGPLYTLLKVATCIAAAEARTQAGRPTVPLFWSGDADDDLAEAVGVRVWDPARATFLKPVPPAEANGRMVGALAASVLGTAERVWLSGLSGKFADRLVELWDTGMSEKRSWSSLHADALRLVFPGKGLLIVSGNDAEMIAAGHPLVERFLARRDDLIAEVRGAGADLTALGYHAQIAGTSLERPVHRAVGDERRRLTSSDEAADVPPTELRPGVVLRSPLQDWLFRPAGVVVGPGERAYLEQLRPLYAALDLRRAPLLPRAFAVLGHQPVDGPAPIADVAPKVAAVVKAAAKELEKSLNELGVLDAGVRAERVAERFRPTVTKAIEAASREREEVRHDRHGQDDWRTPRGTRQERVLPGLWAAALFEDLPDVLHGLAADHIERLAAGEPCEYEIHVDETVLEDSP
mgnify:CR=1 FL=1